jgi:hypothetical protein
MHIPGKNDAFALAFVLAVAFLSVIPAGNLLLPLLFFLSAASPTAASAWE